MIIRMGEHPIFRRDGDNIYLTVPVTATEAALGAKVEVPTIDGRAELKIPPGTQSGQKLRLREKGVPSATKEGLRGDEIVEINITVPMPRDERTKELLRAFSHQALALEDAAKASAAPRLPEECRQGLKAFFESLPHSDAFAITGDIGEAHDVTDHLRAVAELGPVYFVLGNHDFYRGTIAGVRADVRELCRNVPNLR